MEQLAVDQNGIGMWLTDKEKRTSIGGRVLNQGLSVNGAKAYTMKNGRVSGDKGNFLWSVIDSQTNGQAQFGKGTPSFNARTRRDLINTTANAQILRAEQEILNEKLGLASQVSGNASIGAQAQEGVDFNRGVAISGGGFAGAKSDAKIDAAFEWNRKGDYEDVLREHIGQHPQ